MGEPTRPEPIFQTSERTVRPVLQTEVFIPEERIRTVIEEPIRVVKPIGGIATPVKQEFILDDRTREADQREKILDEEQVEAYRRGEVASRLREESRIRDSNSQSWWFAHIKIDCNDKCPGFAICQWDAGIFILLSFIYNIKTSR